MGASAGCASVAGFLQMCLGVALLVIVSTDLRHAGPGSCVYAAADMEQAPELCDTLTVLAWLSVGSSLIIAVGQGALGLFLRMPPRGVEVLARMALAAAWFVVAILTTIATIQADHADHDGQRAHWRHVGLGVAWGMSVLAFLMGLVALVGCLCIDLPLAVLCCCLPCCLGGGPQGGNNNCNVCELTGLACCLYWCLPRSWLPQRHEHECEHGHGTYQPLPPPGYGPVPTHAPAQHPAPYPQHPPPGAGPSGAYPPPTVIHADRPVHPYEMAQPGRAYMAPVYSPFSVGPVPHTVGWGVPVAPAPRPGPWTGQQTAPTQHTGGTQYPQVQPGTGAWYPSEAENPPAGYEGGAGPSAPPHKGAPPSAPPYQGGPSAQLPQPTKGAPSAPPYPKLG